MAGQEPAAPFRLALVLPALLALAGVGAVATGRAFDRAAGTNPALAAKVPGFLQQDGLAAQAKALRDAGRPEAGLDLAERLVRRDPVSAEAVGLLGTARLARGDAQGTELAFIQGARLGWRDASTQLYWFEVALQNGDYGRAAERYSAVARQWPTAPGLETLTTMLEASPGGRQALIARMAAGDPWSISYAKPAEETPPPRLSAKAALMVDAAQVGVRIGCNRIGDLTRLVAAHDLVLANRLWAAQCRDPGDRALVYDGDFRSSQLIEWGPPFQWRVRSSGSLQADFRDGEDGRRELELVNSAPTTLPVLSQSVVVPAGSYRLTWRGTGGGSAATPRIIAALSCTSERALADPVAPALANGTAVADLTFAGGCTAPLLQFWLTPGADPVTIGAIRLEPR